MLELLNDIPSAAVLTIWFQHNGSPANKPTGVLCFLRNCFGERIIGYGGNVQWPPRLPDLTPLDFFLWGFVKDQMYATPPVSLLELRGRITDA